MILVLVAVFGMFILFSIGHPANRALPGLIAAATVTVHRADVRRGMFFALAVRSNGGGFGSSVGGRSGITTSREGEGERQDQHQGGH